jgi:signal transduction histidine kinase
LHAGGLSAGGGGQAEIQVGFEVRDTGIGFSLRDKEHAFDRFYRGKITDAGNLPGSGLGLTIAQLIAILHHGSIQLDGEVGEGACVTLWLPAYPQGKLTKVLATNSDRPGLTLAKPDKAQTRFTKLTRPRPRR